MATKKRRRMRVGAKTATKVQERDVLEKAKSVRDNPDLIFPTCGNPDCTKCVFKKSKSKVAKVHESAADLKKLTNFTTSSFIGDERARAYAATLVLSHADKAPFLARARTPFGEATYATRGKAQSPYLLGIQHYDDQGLRVTHVLNDVNKHGLHIYSTADEMICVGPGTTTPPDAYVNDRIAALKTPLTRTGDVYVCPHLGAEKAVQHAPQSTSYAVIAWKSAGIHVAVCKDCAAKSRENTLIVLAKYIAAKDVLGDFGATIITNTLTCAEECDTCSIEAQFRRDYSGADYVQDNQPDVERIKEAESADTGDALVYIGGSTCYGANLDRFVQDIVKHSGASDTLGEYQQAFNDLLLPALRERAKPIRLSNASLSRLLAAAWDDIGATLIKHNIDDPAFVEELVQRGARSPEETVVVLRESFDWAKYKSVLSSLPTYAALSPPATFADRAAKTMKTRGADAVEKLIQEYHATKDENIKILAYAFLVALGREKGKEWQYSRSQQESGIVIGAYARALFDADSAGYTAALRDLVRATGSTESIG